MSAVVKYDHHFDLAGNRIGNLGAPASANEAATKAYVDAASGTSTTNTNAAIAAALALLLSALPASDPAQAGALWNNAGVLTVSTGP